MQAATVQNRALERCKMRISPWDSKAIGAPLQTTFVFGARPAIAATITSVGTQPKVMA